MIRHIPKILVLNLFAVLMTINAGAQAPSATFHYAVRIPATAQSCQQEADALRIRFSATKNVLVTNAACRGTLTIKAEGSDYQLYSLLLTYQALAVVNPYSAVLGAALTSAVPGNGVGIYDSYAACVADINAQTEVFAAATSLTTLDAFCIATEDVGGFKYKLQMDGVGTKINSLYVFNPKLVGAIDPQLQSGLENLVTTSGGIITKVSSGQIFYYSKYFLDLSNHLLGMFHDPAECQAQVGEAASIFAKAGAKNIIVRCLNAGASTVTLEVVHDGSSMVTEDWGYNNRFYSFNECMGEKARIVQDSGSSTLGGICAPATDLTGQYLLDLFRHD